MSKTAQKTHPELWDKVKSEFTRSGKGGEPGQWSARKAQLALQEYKKRGGGYLGSGDNSLKQWPDKDWGMKSGRNSRNTGERYVPERAREALSDGDYRKTTAKKRADTKDGEQFSSHPEDVAGKTTQHLSRAKSPGKTKPATQNRDALLKQARYLDIEGRSNMLKSELKDAIRLAKH